MPTFHKYLFISQKTKFFVLLYFCSQYGAAEFGKVSVNIMESVSASHRAIPKLNSNEVP